MNEPNPLDVEINDVLAAALRRINTIDPQMRRFQRSLADLGMPVPSEWAEVQADETVTFSSLTLTQFDRLIRLLEDLADHRPITVTVVQGGASLFDPGAPHGPVATPRPSTVHMVVPQ